MYNSFLSPDYPSFEDFKRMNSSKYFSDKERKTEAVFVGDYFEFHFIYDLSNIVEVNKLFFVNRNEFTINEYNHDFSRFLYNHIHNICPHLNGFSGYDTVQYHINESITIL